MLEKVRSKDGTLIAYERSGSGAPLVLVHGTGGDHTRWAPILPALERHFTVCTIDRRGRGQSGDSPEYSLEREFEDIAAVIDSIGGQVNLLGHSYGALCALEAALRTTHVRKLILYEPPIPVGEPMYPHGARERLESLLATSGREAVLVAFLTEIVRMPSKEIELLCSSPAWAGRLAAAHTIPREFAEADYVLDSKRMSILKTPVLLLMGSESPQFLKAATSALSHVLPNCRIVVMQGQQHIAMNTAPELFVRHVVEFLES
ncbi:MAG: alpha/beta hydrolase [Thaumarchaeota archaeon]|nr:alpha/beta hydrolase [Nitrososphaerota archaeon]